MKKAFAVSLAFVVAMLGLSSFGVARAVPSSERCVAPASNSKDWQKGQRVAVPSGTYILKGSGDDCESFDSNNSDSMMADTVRGTVMKQVCRKKDGNAVVLVEYEGEKRTKHLILCFGKALIPL